MMQFARITIVLLSVGAGAFSSPAQQVVVRTEATAASGAVSNSSLVLTSLEDEVFSAPLFGLADHNDTTVSGAFMDKSFVWGLNSKNAKIDFSEVFELPFDAGHTAAPYRFRTAGPIESIIRAGDELAVSVNTGSHSSLLLFDKGAEGFYLQSTPRVLDLVGHAIDYERLSEAGWIALTESSTSFLLEFGKDGTSPLAMPFATVSVEPRRIIDCGGRLAIIASRYDLDRADGAPQTEVHLLDLSTRKPVGQISIPGELSRFEPGVLKDTMSTLWIVTTSPGTESGAAMALNPEDLSIRTVINLPPVNSSLHVLRTDHESVFFACGPAIQQFAFNGDLLAANEFEDPVYAILQVDSQHVIVAEGSRVHRLDEKLLPDRTIQLFSGRAVELGLKPPEMAGLGDGDADHVLDAIDVTPGERVPAINVPRSVILRRGGAPRLVRLDLSRDLPGYRYRLSINPEAGLMVTPNEGDLSGSVSVGLNPSHWLRASSESALIPVEIALIRDEDGETLSRHILNVAVEAREQMTRVLLIPAEPDPDFDALTTLLSLPPHFYSVEVNPNPAPESLSLYDVVAVSVEAGIGGRIPRIALESFTKSGGGLMIVGSARAAARLPEVQSWLTPFGLQVRSAAATLRTVRADCDWCGVWQSAGLGDGLLASIKPPGEVLFMPGRAAREGPMTRAPRGLGRVVFAGTDGLLGGVENSKEIREAMIDAFVWLARARTDVTDSDGDGLADDLEDANENGVVDVRETDFRRVDSDGDLLIDGHEDINGNGRRDEGETDPLRMDTDGDRIPDAADGMAFSPAGSTPGGSR